MNCEEAEPLIEGYFDGELDLVRHLEMEQHVERCSGCADGVQSRQALRSMLKVSHLSYPAPTSLRQWAHAKSGAAAAGRRARVRWTFQSWLPAGAMAMALAAFYTGTIFVSRAAFERRLMQEVVSAHVRSLMASHLADVASGNQHTVKPWFNGKLDFAPIVKDLSADAFPLVGGRLDYLADRPVASVIYRRRRHFINLFLWPMPRGEDQAMKALTHRGYNLLTWAHGGMNYWAVSDLNARELEQFGQIIRAQSLLP